MPDYSFTERTPLEQGFAARFRDQIVPILRRHEDARIAARRKALTGVALALAAGAAAAALSIGLGWDIGLALSVFIGIGGAVALYRRHRNQWSSSLSTEVLPVICDFLGGMSYGDSPISPAEFEALGVAPSHSRQEVHDQATGRDGDLSYALAEVELKQRSHSSKGGTRTHTVFRGLLIRIELTEDVPAVFFGRDYGGLGNWLGEAFSSVRRGRTRVGTGDPEFEELYEVYADDPEAARRFVTPTLMRGLLGVAREETGALRHIAAASRGRHFYLALPRKADFLGLGSLFRPLAASEDDLHQCIADLDLPRRVIAALRVRRPP